MGPSISKAFRFRGLLIGNIEYHALNLKNSTTKIHLFRHYSMQHLDSKNTGGFLSVASETVEEWRNLASDNPWYFWSELTFNPNSHMYPHFEEIMRMCFKKAIVNKMKGQGGNNHSGYYYMGSSNEFETLLKTCCIVSGILLPNFAPVFVDYSSHTSKDLPIYQVLKEALRPHLDDHDVVKIVDVASALREARRKRTTLAVFLVESQDPNVNASVATGLYSLANSWDHCLFLTGGGGAKPPRLYETKIYTKYCNGPYALVPCSRTEL
eukprot:TRINITY_DN1760_c0_g1_i5.p1 TRINITY_DN1760_c0_g1~~TRINITY_DN1760_c0_g1_i5.p1  ORF type:complete len:267 (+),score=39.59 TRINITY_DN1760_c0_g1_i5:51-851(+)